MILFFLSTFLVISCFLLLCLCALALPWKSLDFFKASSWKMESYPLNLIFRFLVLLGCFYWCSPPPSYFFFSAPAIFSFFFKKLNSVVLNPGCITNRIVWKPLIHTGTQVPSWSNEIRSITVKKSPFPQVKVGGVGPICSHGHIATEEIWPFL